METNCTLISSQKCRRNLQAWNIRQGAPNRAAGGGSRCVKGCAVQNDACRAALTLRKKSIVKLNLVLLPRAYASLDGVFWAGTTCSSSCCTTEARMLGRSAFFTCYFRYPCFLSETVSKDTHSMVCAQCGVSPLQRLQRRIRSLCKHSDAVQSITLAGLARCFLSPRWSATTWFGGIFSPGQRETRSPFLAADCAAFAVAAHARHAVLAHGDVCERGRVRLHGPRQRGRPRRRVHGPAGRLAMHVCERRDVQHAPLAYGALVLCAARRMHRRLAYCAVAATNRALVHRMRIIRAAARHAGAPVAPAIAADPWPAAITTG
eukprot:4975496-Pleurochrysis_carterae.AAC.1